VSVKIPSVTFVETPEYVPVTFDVGVSFTKARQPDERLLAPIRAFVERWSLLADSLLDEAIARIFLLSLVRRQLFEAMRHEVDEAIRLDGLRVFDPHVLRGTVTL